MSRPKKKGDVMVDLPRGKPAKEKVVKERKSRFPPAPTPWGIYDPNAEVCLSHPNIKFRPIYVTDADGKEIFCVGTTELDLANAELIVKAVNLLKGEKSIARSA